MTLSECDSTTYTAPFFQDDIHHVYGCTRIGAGAPCSSSLLRLALIAGSAYAMQFTTCVVNVSPSRRRLERTKRNHPYPRKSKYSESALRPISPNNQNAQDVSSSTDLSFGADKRTESTIERQVIDAFPPGSSKSLYSDEVWKPLESTSALLKPDGKMSEARDQHFAEK